MSLTIDDIKKLIIPNSIFKEETYSEYDYPGFRPKHSGYNIYDLVTQIVASQNIYGSHSTLVDNTNGTYTYTHDNGSTVLVDTRANSNPTDTTGIIPISLNTVQKNLEYFHQYILDAQSLFGISWTIGVTPDLGTFTGWTISDNSNIKDALQEIELAVENSISEARNGLTKVAGTGLGDLAKVELGGLLFKTTIVDTKGFRFELTDSISNLDLIHGQLNGFGYGGFDNSVYFMGGFGNNDRSLMGIKNSAGVFTPYMYRENIIAGTSKLIELGSSGISILNNNSTLSSSVLVRTGNVYQGLSNPSLDTFYTELNNSRFRIGQTGTITSYYDLPLVDGTLNQVLRTDGAGTVSWSNGIPNQEIHLQEFLTSEPIIDRNGDSFFLVPTDYNGYKTSSFKWSVFTTNTGTFTVSMERNGVLVPGATVNVSASAQNGNVTFTEITLNTNDRIRFITTLSAGATPSGLAMVIKLIP